MSILLAVLLVAAGLSLTLIPLTSNGRIPKWQKGIHLTSAQMFVFWGGWLWRASVDLPLWLVGSTVLGSLGCIMWTVHYTRMMRRNPE